MWRLGGKRSTFTLGTGVPFAYQHNAIWLRRRRDQPVRRRGRAARQPALARRGHQSRHLQPRPPRSPASSHARLCAAPRPPARAICRRCPAAAGWSDGAGCPTSPNSTPRGRSSTTRSCPAGEISYRVYRLPWTGQPTEPPATVAQSRAGRHEHGLRELERRHHRRLLAAAHRRERRSSDGGLDHAAQAGFETTIPAPAAAFYRGARPSAVGAGRSAPRGGEPVERVIDGRPQTGSADRWSLPAARRRSSLAAAALGIGALATAGGPAASHAGRPTAFSAPARPLRPHDAQRLGCPARDLARVSPLPGSYDASPGTQISLLGASRHASCAACTSPGPRRAHTPAACAATPKATGRASCPRGRSLRARR